MDPLLVIADDLERRDARAAEALRELDELRREVESLRTGVAATSGFLDGLPAALARRRADEQAAAAARGEALRALRDAEVDLERARKEDERLAAARALQQARDGARAADLWAREAQESREQFERERDAHTADGERLACRAAELAERVRRVAPPEPGLAGAADWVARARAELLLDQAALATEREKVVREANELAASVLGEPFAATGVSGIRDRIARALDADSLD